MRPFARLLKPLTALAALAAVVGVGYFLLDHAPMYHQDDRREAGQRAELYKASEATFVLFWNDVPYLLTGDRVLRLAPRSPMDIGPWRPWPRDALRGPSLRNGTRELSADHYDWSATRSAYRIRHYPEGRGAPAARRRWREIEIAVRHTDSTWGEIERMTASGADR